LRAHIALIRLDRSSALSVMARRWRGSGGRPKPTPEPPVEGLIDYAWLKTSLSENGLGPAAL